MKRCENAGIKTLVILADVPSFGYRNKEIKKWINGSSKNYIEYNTSSL